MADYDFSSLDAFLETLRGLPALCEESAAEVAEEFKAETDRNIKAQRDPYGHLWYPSKDGLPVLLNAGEHVTTKATGTLIEIKLTGVEVRHHIGNARGYRGGSAKLGGFRRAIIPYKTLPGPFKAVCRRVLERKYNANFRKAA